MSVNRVSDVPLSVVGHGGYARWWVVRLRLMGLLPQLCGGYGGGVQWV